MPGATENLETLIGLMGKIARAERSSWYGLTVQIRKVPRILSSEAGEQACIIAASGRNLVAQMDSAITENETEFRGVAQSLATILGNELVAHGGPARPHWAQEKS